MASFLLCRSYFIGNQVRDWETTSAIIISNELIKGHRRPATKTARGPLHGNNSIRIKYKYIVNDKEYIGSRLTFSNQKTDLNSLSLKQKEYPVQRRVTIYYNRNNPNNSVIEIGVDLKTVIIPLLIMLFLLIISYFLRRKSLSS